MDDGQCFHCQFANWSNVRQFISAVQLYYNYVCAQATAARVLHKSAPLHLEVTITFSLSNTKNVPNCLLPQANSTPATPSITQLGQAPIPQEICGEL